MVDGASAAMDHRRSRSRPASGQNPTRIVFTSKGFTGTVTLVPWIANAVEGANLSHSSMSVSRALRGVRAKFKTAVEGLSDASYKRTMYSLLSSAFFTDSTITFDGVRLSTLQVAASCPACEGSALGSKGSLNSAPLRVASTSCQEPSWGISAYLMWWMPTMGSSDKNRVVDFLSHKGGKGPGAAGAGRGHYR